LKSVSPEAPDNSVAIGNRSDADGMRTDGALVNAFTGMGIAGKDRTQSTGIRTSYLLSHPELEALYSVGLPRRFVDSIADEVLKHRVTIKLGGRKASQEIDQITDFEAYLKQLKFHRVYAEAVRLQRLYGGAAIVALVDDGNEDPETPVNYDRIRGIRGLCALSRHEIFPMDVSVMDYSKPEMYRITTNQKLDKDQASPVTNMRIHHTRVSRFDGLYLPWRQRQQQQGWGQAPLQVVWDSWKLYETSIRGLASSVTDSSLFWHKVPGLMEMVRAGNANQVMKRMEINNMSRSSYGGFLIDANEEIGFAERSLNNMAQATAPFAEYMQATTGWPASILMGTSPGGLGKEGRFEERVWASLVEDWQTVYCQDPISDIFELFMRAKDSPMRGTLPESWEISFPSVFAETDTEKLAVQKSRAEIDNIYAALRVLSPIEIRNNRYGSAEYSIETVLDENVSAQLQMQEDSMFENNMNQLQAQAFQAQGLGPDGQPIPPEGGEVPGQSQPASQESQPAKPAPKTDSYEALGLTIDVIKHRDGASLGYPVGTTTRNDAAGPDIGGLVLLGPSRSRRYALLNSTIKLDGAILPGPQVTGYASLRAARKGLASFLPEQTIFTLKPSPEDVK
jgi:phage-related protein (TIGR01555 family)